MSHYTILLHFPPLLSTPPFSTAAFSILALMPVSRFPLPHFQSPFAKAHHKITPRRKMGWPWAREAPQILGFPFNTCVTAEANNFKFGMQLEFAKAHHETTPRGKSGRDLGLGKLPNIWDSHLILILQRPRRPLSVFGASRYTMVCFMCKHFSLRKNR